MHSLSIQLLQEHRLVLGCAALTAARLDSGGGWPIPAAGDRDEARARCRALGCPSRRHLRGCPSGTEHRCRDTRAVSREGKPCRRGCGLVTDSRNPGHPRSKGTAKPPGNPPTPPRCQPPGALRHPTQPRSPSRAPPSSPGLTIFQQRAEGERQERGAGGGAGHGRGSRRLGKRLGGGFLLFASFFLFLSSPAVPPRRSPPAAAAMRLGPAGAWQVLYSPAAPRHGPAPPRRVQRPRGKQLGRGHAWGRRWRSEGRPSAGRPAAPSPRSTCCPFPPGRPAAPSPAFDLLPLSPG